MKTKDMKIIITQMKDEELKDLTEGISKFLASSNLFVYEYPELPLLMAYGNEERVNRLESE